MSKRVVIITEIIAPYRIPVFNALALHQDLRLEVIFLAETDKTLRQWPVYKNELQFSFRVLPSSRLRTKNGNFLFNRGLWRALNSLQPEVIVCGGYNYLASWQAQLWAKRRHVPFILWSESNAQDARAGRPWTEFLKGRFVRRCNAFVVPGTSSLQYLRKLGSGARPVTVAPNAVDNPFFSAHAQAARNRPLEWRQKFHLPPKFILFVGRLVPEKGVFDLLEAYAMLNEGVRAAVGLVFAGDGASKNELIRRAEQITPGIISFPGFAHREDLAALYALAEFLVMPTHSDPWGLVINEAMACGLPLIVSDVAGCAADLVTDGWNGLVIKPRSPEQQASSIRHLLQSPEVLASMSIHSLERIQKFSPEICAAGLAKAALLSAQHLPVPASPE